ncbi:MAG TPA: heme-binding protein [Pyrinomonadaceae bacterium]|nr:heme-binding protein [Pyrinomonadaceae bacterium]
MWRRMIFLSCVLFAVYAGAQQSAPVLISHTDSTRAISFDSVTRQREPFSKTTQIKFGSDHATRIMLFAMNLNLQPGETATAVTAEAEDAAHNIYPLVVESVAKVTEQPWATSIVARLDSNLPETGDVLVRIKYRGIASNRVRVGIGQVGGGPPDDIGAIPTPGLVGPFDPPTNVAATNLTATDVQTIIQQAASAAESFNRPVTIVVTDREANVIGLFAMTGAPGTSTVRSVGMLGRGLEGAVVPASEAATAKAATAAFFSTTGNAFSTRTAGFIIQEHFPPGVSFRAGGPLYGVQFSSLPCSDIKIPSARLGLSADPGGLPIYKNGLPAGGIGIEGDGLYTVDRNTTDNDQAVEELIAASGTRGFEAPTGITGDKILVDGIRLPFSNVAAPPAPSNVASIAGAVISFPGGMAPASEFVPQIVGGISGEVSPRFFPFIAGTAPVGSSALTAADVQTIISRAAQQSNITRAAIRQPLGSNARVTIAVVDAAGVVLGVFRQQDAPVFGFDVAVQKARTAAFFSTAGAATQLRAAGFGSYMDRAAADGLSFNGSFAFSDRAIGFLHRPFFPDGINETAAGPLSTPLNEWSPFNVGLQLDLVRAGFLASLGGPAVPCTSITGLPNGIQIFAGSVPLYKNGVLAGAIGISGDGIDQDDLIGAAGANGFSPPLNVRSDQIFVRSVRLPFLKFPRSPNL